MSRIRANRAVVYCGTTPNAKYWLNSEPCGLICGYISWLLLFYGMYAASFGIIIPIYGIDNVVGLLNFLLFNILSLLSIYCHYKAMTTNPGAVPPYARPLLDDIEELLANDVEGNSNTNLTTASNSSITVPGGESNSVISPDSQQQPRQQYRKLCRRCQAFKPARAHHCSICNRCIVKMDHHCPWINNCVGVGNYKLFLQFICWVFIVSVYAIVLSVAKFLSCIREYDTNACGTPRENLLVIFLMVESVLFALFTLIMIGDQMSVIFSNQTKIEKLKNTKFASVVEINEIFGSSSRVNWRWHWMHPAPVRFPRSAREQIYGYRVVRRGDGGSSATDDLLSGGSNLDSSSGIGSDKSVSHIGSISQSSMGSPKTSNLDLLSASNSPDRSGGASISDGAAVDMMDSGVRWRDSIESVEAMNSSSLHSRKRG